MNRLKKYFREEKLRVAQIKDCKGIFIFIGSLIFSWKTVTN